MSSKYQHKGGGKTAHLVREMNVRVKRAEPKLTMDRKALREIYNKGLW